MIRSILTLCAFSAMSSLLSAQSYIDRIVTKSNDTIHCRITLINDQNIFYHTQKRKTEKQLFISLDAVAGYVWESKNQVNQENSDEVRIPYFSDDKWRFGVRAIQQFNYPILHSVVALSLSKQNHSVFAGPNYTRLLYNYFGDSQSGWNYEPHTIGINIGYRYIVNSKWQRINCFLSLDFSIYEVTYSGWGGHNVGSKTIKKLIVENNAGIGLNYKLSDRLAIFGGAGIGSTGAFFLMVSHFIPHSYVGVQYYFN